MGSGRGGTGNRRYRTNRAILLARDQICGICGHGGAQTADHIVPDPLWPRDSDGKRLPGFDELDNLQPAHGTMGAGRGRQNRCPVCLRLCNQSKGDGRRRLPKAPRVTSRVWYGSGT